MKEILFMLAARAVWCGWDLGDPGPSQPSALPRTLSRAHKMTVATVIAGQVKPLRTTVEQPYPADRVPKSEPKQVHPLQEQIPP